MTDAYWAYHRTINRRFAEYGLRGIITYSQGHAWLVVLHNDTYRSVASVEDSDFRRAMMTLLTRFEVVCDLVVSTLVI